MEEYKKITLESYNLNANEFSKKFTYLFDLEKRGEFLKFLSLLSGKKVLDLGCGSGDHALWFKKQGLDMTCVDISPVMVEICKKKGLNAILMDIEDLDFNENSFDGIWAVCSLIHLPKYKLKEVVNKINTLLMPGGVAFICMKEGEGEKVVGDKLNRFTKRYFSYWSGEDFDKLLREFFEIIDFNTAKVQDSTLLNFFLKSKK